MSSLFPMLCYIMLKKISSSKNFVIEIDAYYEQLFISLFRSTAPRVPEGTRAAFLIWMSMFLAASCLAFCFDGPDPKTKV